MVNKNVKRVRADEFSYDLGDLCQLYGPTNAHDKLDDIIKRLSDIKNRLSPDATCDTRHSGYYETAETCIFFQSFRDETDKEYKKRIERETKAEEANKVKRARERKNKEDATRRTYEKLKIRFEK